MRVHVCVLARSRARVYSCACVCARGYGCVNILDTEQSLLADSLKEMLHGARRFAQQCAKYLILCNMVCKMIYNAIFIAAARDDKNSQKRDACEKTLISISEGYFLCAHFHYQIGCALVTYPTINSLCFRLIELKR